MSRKGGVGDLRAGLVLAVVERYEAPPRRWVWCSLQWIADELRWDREDVRRAAEGLVAEGVLMAIDEPGRRSGEIYYRLAGDESPPPCPCCGEPMVRIDGAFGVHDGP